MISDRLGHATTAFTQDVYMRVIPQLEHDAAARIADVVFGPPTSADEDPPEQFGDKKLDRKRRAKNITPPSQ